MAYDEELAARVRDLLVDEPGLTEKAMFGGLAFLLDGNMSVGLSSGGELIVRLGAERSDAALDEPHTRIFDMTRRPMTGWILVSRDGLRTDDELAAWVRRGVAFARSLAPKRPRS